MPNHPLIDAYLDRLDRAADHLPRTRRRELVDHVESWLAEAVGPFAGADEIHAALDRLGPPEELAAAERPRPVEQRSGGALEVVAIIMLLIGGFFAGIGWLVGLGLLWASPVWRVRDKLIGTLLWPGGLVASLWWMAAVGLSASDGSNDILWLVSLIAVFGVPVLTAVHLGRRAGA